MNENETSKESGLRLKKLRQALGLKQGEFSREISTTQGHISDIENGRKNLSERTIKLICLKSWNGKIVNQEWLEEGIGDMFLEIDEKDELSSYVYELLNDPNNELFVLIEEIIHTYMDLKPDSKELFKDISKSILKNLKNRASNMDLD